jgi:hypothetical protein
MATMSMSANESNDIVATDKDDSLPPHDRILFGTKTITISDELTDSIDAALVEGVSSLPRLPQPEVLLQTLRQVYSRNVNVLETYMSRNIFSIHHRLPPSRRKKVVEAFLTNQLPEVAPLSNVTNSEGTKPEFPYPTAAEIPSAEALFQKEQDLKELRAKLVQLKRRRQQLSLHAKKLVVANDAVPILPEETVKTATTGNGVEGIVSSLIQGKEMLDELAVKGKELTGKMDAEKRQWGPDDENAPPAVPKKKKLKLEEAFAADVKATGGDLEGLKQMQQFLRGADASAN